MSTFWDAVGRAALGLPGTAAPRPRSMFEPDGPMALFEDVEPSHNDAGATALTPAAVIFPAPPAVGSVPAIGADEPVPQAQAADQSDDDEQEEVRASSEPATLTAGATQGGPVAAAAGERADILQPPPFAAERIELRRLETTRVVSEVIRELERREVPAIIVSAAARAETDGAKSTDADEPVTADEDTPQAAQPVPLTAEPRAVAIDPSPLSATPQELHPLVVEIERIEIRIDSERVAAPPSPRRAEPTAIPSLPDYLARLDRSRP